MVRQDLRRVVLITGCSSGLGLALCQSLARQSTESGSQLFRVFASARRVQTLEDLAKQGIDVVALDVCKPESIKEAVEKVLEQAGRIDVLINNAGFSSFGPLIEQDPTFIASVMDTNAFGTLRVTQAVAPDMMRRHSGVIINIGSISSRFTTCFAGAYCASKAAQRSYTDALRIELLPFGVHVVWVHAGAIKTLFSTTASKNSWLADDVKSFYHPAAAGIRKRVFSAEDPRSGVSADEAAEQIVKRALLVRFPPRVVQAGGWAWLFTLYGFLQEWGCPMLLEFIMARRFGLTGLKQEMAARARIQSAMEQ